MTLTMPTNMPTSPLAISPAQRSGKESFLFWLPVIVGLAALYVPTLYKLFSGIWSSIEQMHGPAILGLSCWLIYRNWPAMQMASKGDKFSAWGWPFFIIGVLMYAIGHSQDVYILEVGSVLWLLVGIVLLNLGPKALKAQWFALFFMLFMVPLPSSVVDVVTMPMKMAVSVVAENLLYGVGYPISRNGVTLQIDQYMLLVADACAGLHTLLTLEALGLLYLNLARHDSTFRNIGLGLLIVPISFTANVIRVMALILVTYHYGDAAGQGFLHRFAGMVLFLSALSLIIGVDNLLQWYETRRRPSTNPVSGR